MEPLSDEAGQNASHTVDILSGADYVSLYLTEKVTSDREVAYMSVFGWVLPGPYMASATQDEIASMNMHNR